MVLILYLTDNNLSKGKKIFLLSISLQKDKSMKEYLHLVFLIPLFILIVLQTGCSKKESTTTQTPTPVENSLWVKMNSPVDGNITCLALYNSKIYVAGNILFYSDDDCKTWKPDTNSLLGLIPSITFLQVINNYLFLGGGFGVSRLNGNKWEYFQDNWDILTDHPSISIVNVNSMIMIAFLFNPSGVTQRSFNNGNTWDSAISISQDNNATTGQLTSINDSIYYSTPIYEFINVFKYNSNNNTWKFITEVEGVTLYGFENQLYSISNSGGGVQISDDYAKTWYQANNGLTDLNTTSITSSDNRVFVSTDTSGVFVSQDLGKHWIAMNTGLLNKKILHLALLGDYLYAIDNLNTLWRYQILSGKKTVPRTK
jgi:hypothetical protein